MKKSKNLLDLCSGVELAKDETFPLFVLPESVWISKTQLDSAYISIREYLFFKNWLNINVMYRYQRNNNLENQSQITKKSFSLKQKYVCKINRDKYTILSCQHTCSVH